MHWREFWNYLHTWQGYVPATIAVAAALYYGPRKMLETWDWYMDRFHDFRVAEILTRPRKDYRFVRRGINQSATVLRDSPFTVAEIAKQIGRDEKSVRSSLRRLERRGKVKQYSTGWAGWDYKEGDGDSLC